MSVNDDQLEYSLGSSKDRSAVRGAHACTVCRDTKIKCVGSSNDGKRPCDRCKKYNLQCIFEKHRRGRKPGTKLSEASKMLRRFEKGLRKAKAKHRELPPQTHGQSFTETLCDSYPDDEDDLEACVAPAVLISKESQRILNYNEPLVLPSNAGADIAIQLDIRDPVSARIVDEDTAKVLFDLFFLRLNPFINLFDLVLHSVSYVRSRSPFLFTTILMASCKFFKPDAFLACQKMAQELASRAFIENWKSVEVIQAFSCLCYWRDPKDTRVWTYIGYACRMAIELDLNRSHTSSPPDESELQLRERRNRERTYLVLFVHDRGLAHYTGQTWMLPENDLIRNIHIWHERGVSVIRPEDVVVSAAVQLRSMESEAANLLRTRVCSTERDDSNCAMLLCNSNAKLTRWMGVWEHEMKRANGARFHMELIKFLWLYARLFLNSYGLKGSMSNQTCAPQVAQTLSICYDSAAEGLQIVHREFATMKMLRYGQDSIALMTEYFAVFLLRLLRTSRALSELHGAAAARIYEEISKAADAYDDAAGQSFTCGSATYYAKSLRQLATQSSCDGRQRCISNPVSTSILSSIDHTSATVHHDEPPPPAASSVSTSWASYDLPSTAFTSLYEPSTLTMAHPSYSQGVIVPGMAESTAKQQPIVMGSYFPQDARGNMRLWDEIFNDTSFAGNTYPANGAVGLYADEVGPSLSAYEMVPGTYTYHYVQPNTAGYPV